ncbi:MAG: hypothetical protein U0Q14_11355 [Dermatophilaceae bacterium]
MSTQPPVRSADDPVEARLRAALAGKATHDIPSSRPRPPIEWPDAAQTGRRRPSWLLPLAAAASIAAVVAGVVIAQSAGRHTAPTSAATATGAGRTPVVQLPGVELSLPQGWTVKEYPASAGSSPIGTVVCVGPGAQCPVELAALDPTANPVDIELEGGYLSNPQYCDPSVDGNTRTLTAYSTVAIGGRSAEYRAWTHACADGTVHHVAQYVVPTPGGYILWSEHADAAITAAMKSIIAESVLPAAKAGGIRLYDQGIVQSMVASGDGFDVTIVRTYGFAAAEWKQVDDTTHTYHFASSILGGATSMTTVDGSNIQIFSDGSSVTQISWPRG